MATQPDSGDGGLAEAVRFQRDLYLYWRTVAELRGVPLTARGFIARPALRRLHARLAAAESRSADDTDISEGDDARLFFVRRLAQRLGLLTLGESRLLAAERESIARFLSHPLAERLRICLRVWIAGGWWPDAPDPTVTPPRLLAPAPPRLALARRRLTVQLASVPPGERLPIPLASVATVSGRARRSSAARHKELPPDADGSTTRAAILGPLAWLGVVAVDTLSESTTPPPATYTVTSAAIALRQDASALAATLSEAPGRIVIQPNFELIAFPPLTSPTLFLLDTCAREVALDSTARYHLTRESFTQARQHGWSAADVATHLESLSSVALPPNVRVTLADWERQGERLRLTDDVTLLNVPNAAVLDALLADRAAAGWIERRLTPTAALLVPEYAARVRAWLLRRGELPALAGSPRDITG